MSRRALFRPRAIDIARPLTIIRTDDDVKVGTEIVSAQRALPEVGTGVEDSELTERHLQDALLASMNAHLRRVDADDMAGGASAPAADIAPAGKRRAILIPIPVIRAVADYEQRVQQLLIDRFHLTEESYLTSEQDDRALLMTDVDYEADTEDVQFAEKELHLDVDTLERCLDCLEKEQGARKVLAPYETMVPLLASGPLKSAPESLRRQMYDYWRRKREAHDGGTALLRFLRDPPDANNPDPAVAFRPRDEEEQRRRARSNTFDNYKKMRTLRQDMERVRTITEQVLKRERVKHDLSLYTIAVQLAQMQLLGPTAVSLLRQSHGLRWRSISGADLRRELYDLGEKVRKGLVTAGVASSRRRPPKALGAAASTASASMAAGARDPSDSRVGKSRGTKTRAPTLAETLFFDEMGFRAFRRLRYFANGFFQQGVSPYDWRVYQAARSVRRAFMSATLERLHRHQQEQREQHGRRADGSARVDVGAEGGHDRDASVIVQLTTPMAFGIVYGISARLTDPPFPHTSGNAAPTDGLAAHLPARWSPHGLDSEPSVVCFPDMTPLCDQAHELQRRRDPLLMRGRLGRGARIVMDRVVITKSDGICASPASPISGRITPSAEWNLLPNGSWPKRQRRES